MVWRKNNGATSLHSRAQAVFVVRRADVSLYNRTYATLHRHACDSQSAEFSKLLGVDLLMSVAVWVFNFKNKLQYAYLASCFHRPNL